MIAKIVKQVSLAVARLDLCHAVYSPNVATLRTDNGGGRFGLAAANNIE